ncbi:MAG TPA: NADH-quinone oxidoreductase subunit M [Candidatus Dormibacteraeota bacterium]|nr:NADH-quinone oxidoreductase subunit M [Candidatus Dormibacteraeota bacterium]
MTELAITLATPTPAPVPGANIFSSPILLSLIIWVPVIVAAALAVMPNPRGRYDVAIKQIAFFTNLGLLVVLFIAYNQFENFLPTAQYEEKLAWLPGIGVTYHLGVDGPGITTLVMSGLVGIAAVLASWGVRERVRAYFCLLLLSESAVSGAIVARDMFVLVLFWAAAAVPLSLLILGWGGPRRTAAAWHLLGYWGLGTAALAIGTFALYAVNGGTSFDMDTLLKVSGVPSRIQIAVGLVMIVAAATRLPLFPLHGWIRDVVGEAPAGVAVIVAGSAARLGALLLLRTVIAAWPAAGHILSPLLAALAALTVGFAGLWALRTTDIRHAGAYLAMVPGGMTVLGLAAASPLGIAGAVLSLFTGGLSAALIAGVAATLAERAQSRNLLVLSGLAPRMPNIAWLLTLAAFALLGVPILASYSAQVMTFFGAFKNQPIGAFAVAAGLAITAIALAVLLRRVLFGAPNPEAPGVSDASLGETWYLGILAGALLWVGLFPGGPKIPGTDFPLFDPGLMNQMAAGVSDMAAPYVASTPAP